MKEKEKRKKPRGKRIYVHAIVIFSKNVLLHLDYVCVHYILCCPSYKCCCQLVQAAESQYCDSWSVSAYCDATPEGQGQPFWKHSQKRILNLECSKSGESSE
ncbi:hypothetical protein STEG23_001230 [Scotinomys teguina]